MTDMREKTIPSRAGGSSPAQAVDMRGMPYFYSVFVAAAACLLLLLLALPARGQNQKATCLQRPRSRRLYRAKFSPCQGEGECARASFSIIYTHPKDYRVLNTNHYNLLLLKAFYQIVLYLFDPILSGFLTRIWAYSFFFRGPLPSVQRVAERALRPPQQAPRALPQPPGRHLHPRQSLHARRARRGTPGKHAIPPNNA